ncbi:MAG: SDR family oxidoreductase, partial [Actinomycetota bacterium]|nr:SDR family oxidoreductase [Actinomycetota bacterium]
MDNALTGRRVLIVGASAGIGAALGQATIQAGASVTISARRQDKLDSLVADWGAGNAIAADATDPGAVRAMVAAAAHQMGGLDLVVYVAGIGFLQPLAETDPDVWVDVFRVNVVGANLVAGAALDHLDPDGAVAFISSRTVEDNNAFFAPYSATKAALNQCIRGWRAEHP